MNTETKRALGPWAALGLLVLTYLVLQAVSPMLRAAAAPFFHLETPREIVLFRGLFAIASGWIAFAAVVLILRLRGQTLADIGWGRRSSVWGWLGVVVVLAFYTWSSFFAYIRPGLHMLDWSTWSTDWSLFRIGMAVGIGITAGISEEAAFRGFVMTQARDGRAPVLAQILLSGVLFGAAHFGWGGLGGGGFHLAAALGAVAATTVFGTLFAIVYAIGGRSLLPCILGHMVFNFIMEPWMLLRAVTGGFG